MPDYPTIAFVETKAQVQALLDARHPHPKVGLWLAVTPEAAWSLRLNGISYYKLEDFYDASSKCRESQKVLEVENAWVDWIDDFLGTRVQAFREHDFRPARMYYYSLKILVDQLYWRAQSLLNIYSSVKPGTVAAWPENPSPPELPDFDVCYKGSVLSVIIPEWVSQSGLELLVPPPTASIGESSHTLGHVPKPAPVTGLRQRLLAILPEWARPYLRAGMRGIRGVVAEALSRDFLSSARDNEAQGSARVIAIRGGYDVAFLKEALRDRGVDWIDASAWATSLEEIKPQDIELVQRLRLAWNEVDATDELWQPFVMSGLDLREVARPRLHYWWTIVVPQMWRLYHYALEALDASVPSCVITPLCAPRPREPAFLHAAKRLNIPRIIYQHGGFVGVCEFTVWENVDLANADWELVYGEGVAKYLNRRRLLYYDYRAQPLVVGSSRLDALRDKYASKRAETTRARLGIKSTETMILYIPTILRGYNAYMCCNDYPAVSYSELQASVIELFRRFGDFRFIYKTFDDTVENPIHQIIRDSCPNVLNVTHPPLTDLMWAADAIIVDFPSTGLLEVLLTDKPLVVYADRNALRMFPEAKQMLRKRARFAETPEDFLMQIEQLLEKGDFEKVPDPDTSFLRTYGTFLDDGRSAERAVDVLHALATEHRLPDFALAGPQGQDMR